MFLPCFNFNLCLDSYFLYAQESQQRWISSPVQWPNKGFLISGIFLMRVFSLQLLFPAFFLSFLSPCALLRCSLFSCLVMHFFLSYVLCTSFCFTFTLPRFITKLASPQHGPLYFWAFFYLSVAAMYICMYICRSQTVHGNELSASLRHSVVS